MSFVRNLRQFLSGTKKDASAKPPAFLAWRSSTFFIIMTVCLAIFTDIFYYALIVPVIPFSLTVRVGLPEDQVQQWTAILLACYSAALFVGSPIAGFYADHSSSRRWPLLLGLLALAASTLLLCLGRTIWLLVVGRLLQGISAAIVWSVGCALLVDTMESAVGVGMGYVSAAMSVALLIAPTVGGSVYAAAGYYPVYYIAFGIVLVDILLRLAMIEKKVARQWEAQEPPTTEASNTQVDVEKAATARSGDAGGENSTPKGGEAQYPESSSNGGAEIESQPIERGERRSISARPDPSRTSNTPDLHQGSKLQPLLILVRSPRLLAALYGTVVQAGIMMGADAVLALFVQKTFGWNSTAAGLLFLAIFLPGFVAPAVGLLADRHGARLPSVAGFCVLVPALVCMRFVTEDTLGHKVLLAALLAVAGAACAASGTPLMAEITYAIADEARRRPGVFGPRGAYGLGYGLFTTAFALGGVVGPLWAGYVNASPGGWATMTWSLALWAASGAVVMFFWLGGKPEHEGGNEAAEGRPTDTSQA